MQNEREDDRGAWLKIWHFPLVTMCVAATAMIAVLGLSEWVMRFVPEGLDRNVDVIVRYGFTILAAILVYKLVIPRLGAHKHDDLPMRGAISGMSLGLGAGIVVFSCVIAAAAIGGYYTIVGPGSWVDFIEILMTTGLAASVIEEILFRGILFRWLEEFSGSWIALFLSSAIFGFMHLPSDNPNLLIGVIIALEGGMLLTAAYMLTRNLWLAIGLHAGWNIAQAFIWGVPMKGFEFEGLVQGQTSGPAWLSGGTFGMEMSVFGVVVTVTAGLLLLRAAYRKGRFVPPMWKQERS